MCIVGKRAIDRDPLDFPLQPHQVCRIEDTLHVARGIDVPVEHQAHFHVGRRIADAHAQQETIELGFRQRESPGEILGVLRRDDEEGLGRREHLTVERYLPLVHRLKKRGLGSWARAVDFVCEEDIGKYGPCRAERILRGAGHRR